MQTSLKSSPWHTLLEKDEIRLLNLQPGSGSEGIYCSFNHVRLSEKPEYEALSYMWGSEHSLKPIDIDGEIHHIRENLWQALYHLRHPQTTRVLWADALSINQLNHKERAHQVTQMGTIYSNSSTVCIWLGISDTSSDRAFDFLGRESSLSALGAGLIEFPSVWEDVARLGEKQYWKRLWIIQEVTLANKIVLYCGHLALPWGNFTTTLRAFRTKRMYAIHETTGEMRFSNELSFTGRISECMALKLIGQHEDPSNELSHTQHHIPKKYLKSIFLLVNEYQHANCADARDKIYGLLSLAPACCRVAVPIDYECSAYSLCRRVLEHHFSSHFWRNQLQDIFPKSQALHRLIITGQVQQRGSQNNFPCGIPDGIEAEALCAESKPCHRIMLQIYGRIEDTIHLVTPPLRTLSGAENIKFEIPYALRRALSTDLLPDLTTEMIYHCLDLICHRTMENGLQAEERVFLQGVSPRPETDSGVGVERGTEKALGAGINQQWSELFAKISIALEEYPDAQDCVVFVGEEDVIGLAEVGVKVGDTIWAFNNVAAIIRSDLSPGHQIISRCWRHQPVTSVPESIWRSEDSTLRYVTVSVRELQILSMISEYSLASEDSANT